MARAPKRERTKREVQNARMGIVMSLVMTLFYAFLLRPVFHDLGSVNAETNSLIFGDIKSWPHFVRAGWLPIDFALCWLMSYGIVRMMVVGNGPAVISENDPYFLKLLFGIGCFLGTMLGSIFTIMAGWYHGLEAFGFGFIVAVVLTVCIGAIIGAGAGIVWVGTKIQKKMQNREPVNPGSWDERWAMLGEANRRFWHRVSEIWLIQPFMMFGRWVNASDVPDPVPDDSDDD